MNDSALHTALHERPADGLVAFVAADEFPHLQDLLQRLQRTPLALAVGGIQAALAWATCNPLPAIVMVDVSQEAHPMQALAELTAAFGPDVHIIVLGERHDVDLYRRLLQAGVVDYLVKPLRLELLADTLSRVGDGLPLGQGAQLRAGRTVAVLGAGGGCGVSTVVAGLGKLLVSRRQIPSVLVDFDRSKSDVALLLGADADAGLAALLAAPEIDPRLLQRSLTSIGAQHTAGIPQRLHLLAQRPAPHSALDPERVLQLGGALAQLFSMAVWDLPACHTDGVMEVLEHADVRVLVCEINVQHARHVHRLLQRIGDERSGQRVLLVHNATRQSASATITVRQFEEFIGRSVDVHLPYAGSLLADSVLAGALDLTRHAGFEHALLTVADLVLGRPAAGATLPSPSSWLHKLRSGALRTAASAR